MRRVAAWGLAIIIVAAAQGRAVAAVQENTAGKQTAAKQEKSSTQKKSANKKAGTESKATENKNYPPKMTGAAEHVYKTIGDTKLSLYVFNPATHTAADKRPAIVCFFGGGWNNGSPVQFEQHCRYLASRGMVAITADYRVASRHQCKVTDCVSDAKSAIRWVRANAARLGVDPDRIVAAGGSAGGHLAACTAVIEDFTSTTDDSAVSAKPNAMVLFNPAVSFDLSLDTKNRNTIESLTQRMGTDPENLSPAHHIHKGDPPALILIGTDDFLIAGNRQYIDRMKAAGNRCELDLYEGKAHGFFNYGRAGNEDFRKTLTSTDKFLASLQYLNGPPTVDQFFAEK